MDENEAVLPKIFIGFILFNEQTAKYLPSFLSSLKEQSFNNFRVLAFNNGDGNNSCSLKLKEFFPQAEILGDGENKGFASAYNSMIEKAVGQGADYFWVTNTDVVYNTDVLEKMISRLEGDKELGSVCPKILRWDFEKDEKTDVVDTYGIEMKEGLVFSDFGQGNKDNFDFRYAAILGPSGASGLYRAEALQDAKDKAGYFDANFFMYKEDCELSYRLMMAGWETAVVPEAVAWHDRTALSLGKGSLSFIKGRFAKSKKVRAWSFHNQILIFLKHWKSQSFKSKIKIIAFVFLSLLYASFFEFFLWKEFLLAIRLGRFYKS